MELLQEEIKAGIDNFKQEWTPRWLLAPAAMETILANPEKRTASVKITETNVEDWETITKNDIWFVGKYHRTDLFTEISPDTVCTSCCHWGYITLQCPNMKNLRYQLCTGTQTTRNHKCEVTTCRGRGENVCTNTIANCVNCKSSHYATLLTFPVPK